MMALTATATPRVQKDILWQLNLRQPVIHRFSFNRPNLFLEVQERQKRSFPQILNIINPGTKPSDKMFILSSVRNIRMRGMNANNPFDIATKRRLRNTSSVSDTCFYKLIPIVPAKILGKFIRSIQFYRSFLNLIVLKQELYLIGKEILGIQIITCIIHIKITGELPGPLTA